MKITVIHINVLCALMKCWYFNEDDCVIMKFHSPRCVPYTKVPLEDEINPIISHS